MKNPISLLAAALIAVSFAPLASRAADDGHLWEVSTRMEMPEGMPEGMGAMGGRTVQVCRGDDPEEAVTKDKEMKECEIKDLKKTDTTVSMTAVCKKGRTVKMEMVYNKAKTSYKGTMHVTGKDEMTMHMTGKKLGPCDAKQAKAEQTAKIEKYKVMGESAQARYAEAVKKSERDQIKGCEKGLDTMNIEKFGVYGTCYGRKDKDCKSVMADYEKTYPKVAAKCSEKAAEFCELFQTQDGFSKAGRDASRLEAAGRMCGVKPDNLRSKLCKSASKEESFAFVGAHCPDEAKPLAKKHCAGRSYTVKEGDPRRVEKKWFKFCVAVAGANLGGSDSEDRAEAAPTPEDVKKAAKSEAKAEAKKAAKGAAVDALKGLFGR